MVLGVEELLLAAVRVQLVLVEQRWRFCFIGGIATQQHPSLFHCLPGEQLGARLAPVPTSGDPISHGYPETGRPVVGGQNVLLSHASGGIIPL